MFLRTWSVCRHLRRQNLNIAQRFRNYSTKRNHYDVLGVPGDATGEEIQEAYISKSKKYHPDMNKDDPKAKEKFIEISNAYAVLSKDSTRDAYDDELDMEDMMQQKPFKEHEYYGRYSESVEDRVNQERDKWKRYYKSGQSMWKFEAENEQWQGKSQYEYASDDKSVFTKGQLQLIGASLVILAIAINVGGMYSTAQLIEQNCNKISKTVELTRSKRDAEKAAVVNALKELDEQRKQGVSS